MKKMLILYLFIFTLIFLSYLKFLLIQVLEMGFGEVGNEPIENVHFYSKQEPNKAFKMEKYQVQNLTSLKHLLYRILIHDCESLEHWIVCLTR